MENDLSNIVEALEPGLLCVVSNSHADDVPRWDLSSVHMLPIDLVTHLYSG